MLPANETASAKSLLASPSGPGTKEAGKTIGRLSPEKGEATAAPLCKVAKVYLYLALIRGRPQMRVAEMTMKIAGNSFAEFVF